MKHVRDMSRDELMQLVAHQQEELVPGHVAYGQRAAEG